MILFCYDGSADAQTAIDHAARLMAGTESTVLTIWQPFVDALMSSAVYGGTMGLGLAGTAGDIRDTDAANEQAALETATEGAQRATEAGLVAFPRVAARHGGIANAIVDAASDVNADVIVCGTRGRSGVTSFLLGSVSHEIVQHADRAVMVVPSGALADTRRALADHTRAAAGNAAIAPAMIES
jgi:nucleotide-binding universal stress UspA family protein